MWKWHDLQGLSYTCREHLAEAEIRAGHDQEAASGVFKDWAKTMVPDAEFMNVGSTAQVQQLLFAGLRNSKPNSQEELPAERVFKARNLLMQVIPVASFPTKAPCDSCFAS